MYEFMRVCVYVCMCVCEYVCMYIIKHHPVMIGIFVPPCSKKKRNLFGPGLLSFGVVSDNCFEQPRNCSPLGILHAKLRGSNPIYHTGRNEHPLTRYLRVPRVPGFLLIAHGTLIAAFNAHETCETYSMLLTGDYHAK